MKGFRFTIILLVFLLLFNILEMASEVQAVGWIEMGLSGDSNRIDINETDEPLVFHGWLNYTGISVVPLRVYLYATVTLGETLLSESEFVFHIPANETFIVYIYIETMKGNESPGQLLLSSSIEQGAATGSGPSIQVDYLILNSSQEEEVPEGSPVNSPNNDVQATVTLILLSLLIVVYGSARKRLRKS